MIQWCYGYLNHLSSSIHLSVTMVDYVNMEQDIVKRFPPSGSHVNSSFSVPRSRTNLRGASLLVLFSLYLPFQFQLKLLRHNLKKLIVSKSNNLVYRASLH